MKTLIAAFILTLTLTSFSFAGENMADCGFGNSELVKDFNTIDIAQPVEADASSAVK